MNILIWIILIGVAWFFLDKFIFSKFKLPKIGAITLFTGGVKTGKSAVSLYFAIDNYKRTRFNWGVRQFFIKFFNLFRKDKLQFEEEPLFYSNIPVCGLKYCQLTTDHLLRKVRFNYKSTVFIDEASLMADSTLIKDKKINNELLLFFKLFGHETHGGTCIINSHCISDLHFAVKRCTNEYFYIHQLQNFGLFLIAKARELKYSDDDNSAVNVFEKDVEDSLVNIFLLANIFKKYDCYAYSTLTDNLALDNQQKYLDKYSNLKATDLPTFREEFKDLFNNNNNGV